MLAETRPKIIRKFDVFWTLGLWPLFSPDNNTHEYALLGVSESKVKGTWYGNIDHLKSNIIQESSQLSVVFIRKINKNFRACMEAFNEAEGWNLEKH